MENNIRHLIKLIWLLLGEVLMIRVLFYVVGEEAPKLTCEKEAEGEKKSQK